MSIRLSSKEQEDLVIKNQRLVYYIVNKLGKSYSDYDDLVSIGTIGLIKAAANFDDSKGIKFATFATTCINNEILMHFRKEKSHANDISLDEPIAQDSSSGNELTVADVISSSDEGFTGKLEKNQDFEKVISIILNALNSKERLTMLHYIAGNNQRYIGNILNISQSYVSRLIEKACKKVKFYFSTKQQYKEVFSMTVVDNNSYKITFFSKDVKQFNKIFSTLLLNLKSEATLPNFKVSCNKERIVIYLPADAQSFSFVAQIIQEIDNFDISFKSSNKDLLKLEDENVNVATREFDTKNIEQKMKEPESPEVNPINEDLPESESSEVNPINEDLPESETDENPKVETDDKVKSRKDNKTKKVRDYILTLQSFTSKELSQQFPDLSIGDIGSALHIIKNKGLITSTGRGKYIVNENSPKPETIENPKAKKCSKAKPVKDNKVEKVRNYMLTLESFTFKELSEHFPDLSVKDIRNALYLAKNKGLITSTDRGKYTVNKD